MYIINKKLIYSAWTKLEYIHHEGKWIIQWFKIGNRECNSRGTTQIKNADENAD